MDSWCSAWSCFVAAAEGLADDDDKETAIEKDRKKYRGTWQVVSVVVNGNKAEDAKKITVVNEADGKWSIRVDGRWWPGGEQDRPEQQARAIDLTATEATQGADHAGHLRAGKGTRKVCIAEAGKERRRISPPKPAAGAFLATFKRVKK